MADHQLHATELFDDFSDHDRTGLSALTDAQLTKQIEARRVLHEYVDEMWQAAKAAGLDPTQRENYVAVAALRDLTNYLYECADGVETDRDG